MLRDLHLVLRNNLRPSTAFQRKSFMLQDAGGAVSLPSVWRFDYVPQTFDVKSGRPFHALLLSLGFLAFKPYPKTQEKVLLLNRKPL